MAESKTKTPGTPETPAGRPGFDPLAAIDSALGIIRGAGPQPSSMILGMVRDTLAKGLPYRGRTVTGPRALDEHEMHTVLDWFLFYMTAEQRGRLMAELPQHYMKLTGCRPGPVLEHVRARLAEVSPRLIDEDEPEAFAAVQCERHGGPWGGDPTCTTCTTESGAPREPAVRR